MDLILKFSFFILFTSSAVFGFECTKENFCSPSQCGAYGCNNSWPSELEILSTALKSPQVVYSIGISNIESIFKVSEIPRIYRIQIKNLNHSFFDLRIEFIELPKTVDGVSPIQIGTSYAIITINPIRE